MQSSVDAYIDSHWNECIKENMNDVDKLIGLPYPYTVPAVGHFDCMYYWDTYFTNKGLECSERYDQSKNNTDDMLYLVDKFGFMPNGNQTNLIKQSQPPFLSIMVRDVYEHYKDRPWLIGAYEMLRKEYDFWMTNRMSPIGLNQYNGNEPNKDWTGWAMGYKKRMGGVMPVGDLNDIGHHFHVTCESGWDTNPRWGLEGFNYVQVDLNSLLYMFEKNMQFFSKVLENGQCEYWRKLADQRAKLMCKYLDDGNGILLDYNFAKNKHSEIFSAASFYPMFAALISEQRAEKLVENLFRLETEYGIVACEKNEAIREKYQWGYPNGWACLHYIVVIGLLNYGYTAEAKRIAKKFIMLVDKVFEETGNLWEKYNVVEGNINVNNEYKMPQMMGWSAGVYKALQELLERK